MEIIKIEKGVPIPSRRGSRWSDLIGTLRKMKVGDSFVCSPALANSFRGVAPRNRMKVTGRKMPDGQIRVWRTE